MNEFISPGFAELNINVGSNYLAIFGSSPLQAVLSSAWNLEEAQQAQLLLKDTP